MVLEEVERVGYKKKPTGRHTLGDMLRGHVAGTSPLECTALAHVAGTVRKLSTRSGLRHKNHRNH